MIWKRMNAALDGSRNGGQKFDFPQNRAQGVGANPTTILRNSHEITSCYPLCNPSTIIVRFTFTTSGETNLSLRYLFCAPTKIHDHYNTQHTPSYVIPFITTAPPSRIPSASSSPITSALFLYGLAYAFALLSGLIPFPFTCTPQL